MRSVGNILRAAPRMLVPVVRAYERRLSRYGPTAQGVFWKNQEWQLRRYAILETSSTTWHKRAGLPSMISAAVMVHYSNTWPTRRMNVAAIGTDMSQGMIGR